MTPRWARIDAGDYASESEVVREGLRSLAARDRALAIWLAESVAPAYDRLLADPSRAMNADEVRGSVVPALAAVTYAVRFAPEAVAPRDDIRPGLHTSSFKKRVVVAYAVDDRARALTVVGLFYGGQDCVSLLAASDDD